MVLSSADLAWYRSTTGDSEGGAKGVVPITSGVDNNVFPDITEVDLAAGGTRTRKIFLGNNSGADPMLLPVIWLSIPPTNITERLGVGFDDADDDEDAGGVLTAWTPDDVLEAVSSGSDTRSLRIVGVDDNGDPAFEDIVLNGTTPVPTTTVWSDVYAIHADAVSGTRTVTVKMGAGGTTMGTIPPNLTNLWRWVTTSAKANGITLPDLGAGESYGIWREQVWAPGAGGIRPNPDRIRAEEA